MATKMFEEYKTKLKSGYQSQWLEAILPFVWAVSLIYESYVPNGV